jgi:hypothetical protein
MIRHHARVGAATLALLLFAVGSGAWAAGESSGGNAMDRPMDRPIITNDGISGLNSRDIGPSNGGGFSSRGGGGSVGPRGSEGPSARCGGTAATNPNARFCDNSGDTRKDFQLERRNR